MIDLSEQKDQSRSGFKSFLQAMSSFGIMCFAFLIKILSVAFIIYGVWKLVVTSENREINMLIIASACTLFAVGVITFTLFLILRYLRELSSRSTSPVVIQPSKSGDADSKELENSIKQLLLGMSELKRLLNEVNENILLDEEGKKQKYEFLVNQKIRNACAEVDKLIENSEWSSARAILEALVKRYPDKKELQDKLEKLEIKRKEAFQQELSKARKLINDFIAISAWDKAVRQAESLLEKHPDSEEAKELVAQISQERQKFRIEQIRRMEADIQRSITRKRWNDALAIAQQLIDKYPDSPEAELLREKIDTLRANAEIEKRQQLEEQIKDLIRRENFIQALELVRYVIKEYPNSPQAQKIREDNLEQKLEERARNQEKKFLE